MNSDSIGITKQNNITGTSGQTGILMQISQSAGSTHHAHFFVGKDGGSKIHYDGSADKLHLSSSNFFLGGGGQFVSGSNGNIEISSSNFHLQPDGDVTMTGDVTANTGRFGGATGWVVGSNKLTSNSNNIALDANAGDIIVGSGANIVRLSGTSDATISAGSLTALSAPFQVSKQGAMTASAAQITGKVTATSGQIATFTITSGSIDSNASNAKRGLKLEPGDSIRGYGNTVHTTQTVQGKFSFGVATVAPPADAPVQWSNDLSAAPGGGNPSL